MNRNKSLGLVAAFVLAAGAVIFVPASADATSMHCYPTSGYTKWTTVATIGTNVPCAYVQASISVYNNYGLAGTYNGRMAGDSSVTAPVSSAPGTYTVHLFRYKAVGYAWTGWMTA